MPFADALKAFLQHEVESLENLDYIVLLPSGRPLSSVEIGRAEDGGLVVAVPGRPPIAPELAVEIRSKLRARGFRSEDPAARIRPWVKRVEGVEPGIAEANALLTEVMAAPEDSEIDIVHGTRKHEFAARRKLQGVRERLQELLMPIVDSPVVQDSDGDFLLNIGDVRVTVAPRTVPDGPVIVRVFAVTNVNVTVTPELGILLARLNFGLIYGRFALDAEHSAIWFDDTLLGEHFSDEELRFAVRVVSSTADEWDDRLKQMFGGMTYQEVLKMSGDTNEPPVKPGEGSGAGMGMYL